MRLFTALPLPVDTRQALIAWTERCGLQPALRWTPHEQLYITLHFLGEVADERAPNVAEALDLIRARGFDVTLERLEVLGRDSVLAAAAIPTTSLSALEVDVRSRVNGFANNGPETIREFRPHVTLARARRGELVPKLKTLPPPPRLEFAAACFRLYCSELRPRGATHTVLQEWRLG